MCDRNMATLHRDGTTKPDWAPPTGDATVKGLVASSFAADVAADAAADAAAEVLEFHSRYRCSMHRSLEWWAASPEGSRHRCRYSADSMPSAKCPIWRRVCRHLWFKLRNSPFITSFSRSILWGFAILSISAILQRKNSKTTAKIQILITEHKSEIHSSKNSF